MKDSLVLVTSIHVYTKYLLRADLAKLDREGRIDLKELGLVQEDSHEQSAGAMYYTVLKNATQPFRRGTAESDAVSQVTGEGTEVTP